MATQIQCPNRHCGNNFECSETDFGKVISCPHCQRPVAIPANPNDEPVYRQIGDYRLIRLIARGGMGEVHEAIQTNLDRRVAVKIINVSLANDPAFIKRFEREAKASAKLNHPNLVQVYDFGKDGDLYYLVMELVDGEDLAKRVGREGHFGIEDALIIVENIVLALQEAQSHDIIHRDIKPANILINSKGLIKVSDLGLARGLEDDVELTATGIGMGSPHYISPEQAEDASKVDHRSDIYSLGISLLFLLTGKRPFEGKTAMAIMMAHANQPLPRGLELGVELPEPIENLIGWMSAKRLDERYRDYETLLNDIRRLRNGESPLGPTGSATPSLTIHRDEMQPDLERTLSDAAVSPTREPSMATARSVVASPVPRRPSRMPWILGLGIPAVLVGCFLILQNMQAPVSKGNHQEPVNAQANSVDTPGTSQVTEGEILEVFNEIVMRNEGGNLNNDDTRGAPFPMPPLEVITNPMPDASFEIMLESAKLYASSNPQRYRHIVAHFEQVLGKAEASDPIDEDQVEALRQELQRWKAEHQEVGDEKYQEYLNFMFDQIRSGNARRSIEHWRLFPGDLRSEALDQRLRTFFSQLPGPPEGQRQMRNGGPGNRLPSQRFRPPPGGNLPRPQP